MGHAFNKREAKEKAALYLQRYYEGVTAQQLTEHLHCHLSTAYRYLDEFRDEGVLLETGDGLFSIDPLEVLSNVRFHPDEALAIYVALRRIVRMTSVAPYFMITAIQKIIPAIQSQQLVDSLTEAVRLLEEECHTSDAQTEIWRTLMRGWRENRVVRIDYIKRELTEPDTHDIEVYLFEPMVFGDGTYVIAWSRTRAALRTFKPDRIQRAVLTNERFRKPDNLNVNVLLRHAWGIWFGKEPIQIELLFAPHVASRVLESSFLPTEEKRMQVDGWLYWTAEVVGWLEILSWVRGWGPNVKVLAPDELRLQIIEDLEKAQALYDG
jgi:predicted DNA-binding transcriptional regulator YafY